MKVRYRGTVPLFECGLHVRPGGTYDIPASVLAKFPREAFTPIEVHVSILPVVQPSTPEPPPPAAAVVPPLTTEEPDGAAVDIDEPDKKGRKRRGHG